MVRFLIPKIPFHAAYPFPVLLRKFLFKAHLEESYNRSEFSLDEGERMLRELDSIREHLQQLHGRLLSLTERCAQISPLWQRGERVGRSIPVNALCEYKSKEINIRQGRMAGRGQREGTGFLSRFISLKVTNALCWTTTICCIGESMEWMVSNRRSHPWCSASRHPIRDSQISLADCTDCLRNCASCGTENTIW